MNALEKLLVYGTAISLFSGFAIGSCGFIREAFGQEKVAPWKEKGYVKDLTVEEALRINETNYVGLVTIGNDSPRIKFEGRGHNQTAVENMHEVIQQLADKFTGKKVYFSYLNLDQLLDKGYSPDEIQDFMWKHWKITPKDLPTTIMYKAGKFKSLEEKEMDRMSCGPKDGGPKPGRTHRDIFIDSLTYWVNYNLLEIREEEDIERGICYLLFEGRCVTNKSLPNGTIEKGGWRNVECNGK